MHFLKETVQDGRKLISFITANDETGFLHLYLYKIYLDTQDFVKISDGK